jgi:DNA-binding LacI/PurR family transcriptional regulator
MKNIRSRTNPDSAKPEILTEYFQLLNQDFSRTNRNAFALFIILSGHSLFLENNFYHPISSGHVFITLPKQKIHLKSVSGLSFYIIWFPSSFIHELRKDLGSLHGFRIIFDVTTSSKVSLLTRNKVHLEPEDLPRIKLLVEALRSESENQGKEKPFALRVRLQLLILELCRHLSIAKRHQTELTDRLQTVLRHMESHYSSNLSLAELARISKLSKFQFIRVFENMFGSSPIEYFRRIRINKALQLMTIRGKSITDIAYETGFPDSNYFSRAFKKTLQITPREYRKRIQLRKGERIIGLFIHWFKGIFNTPHYPKMLSGLLMRLSETPYEIHFISTPDYTTETQWLELLDQNPMVGAVCIDGLSLFNQISRIETRNIPMVNLNDSLNSKGIPSFTVDNEKVGSLAASHFLEKGHTRFAIIAGNPFSTGSVDRVRGFRKTLKQAGIRLQDNRIYMSEYLTEGIIECSRRILALDDLPLAVFCVSDFIAHTFYQEVAKAGKRIPQDFSVIGVDDLDLSAHISPPLTTFRLDMSGLGRLAIESLIRWIEEKKRPEGILLEGQLVERSSVLKIDRS